MKVVPVRKLDFRNEPYVWEWAVENRKWILDHFEMLRVERPQFWNGKVFMLREYRIDDETISGQFFETDFASMLGFRARGFPDGSAMICAASVALRTADGAYVLGEMSDFTANAGRIYFVAGAPDMNDLRADGRIDLAGSTVKELHEEAGLEQRDVHFTGRWHAVATRGRLSMIREADCALSTAALVARIRAFIASQREPELADVVSVRSPTDFTPAMPDFIQGYLAAMFSGEGID